MASETNSNNIPLLNAALFLCTASMIGGFFGIITGAALIETYGETEQITKTNRENVPITRDVFTDESVNAYIMKPFVGGLIGGFALGLIILAFVKAYQSQLATQVGNAVNSSMDNVKRLFCNSFKAVKDASMSLNDSSQKNTL